MNPTPGEFREFLESFQKKVFRLVASILGPYRDMDVEDVTQEVFLEAYRSWSRYRGEALRSTWLYAIARHRALDARKRARFRLPHVEPSDLLPAPPRDADQQLAVARAVERLPETYRTLLYLYYWQGCGVDEIAEFTGMPSGTVKSYLARARKLAEEFLSR